MTEPLAPAIQLFLTGLDLIGTFVFGLSGAVAAAKRGLDVFGILVLSVVAATTGGIIRDVLIGAIPLPHWSTGATLRSRSRQGS